MAKNTSRLILVTGATGRQGGAVLRHLRQKGFPVRAFTRDPASAKARALVGQGTEVVHGDLDDPASITRALDGVYGVYSVQNWRENGLEAEVRRGKNVADAAKRSRISHLVYSSVAGADEGREVPHFASKLEVEEYIRRTGLPFTIVRPVYFMENWLAMRESIANGTIEQPLKPETNMQMVAVDDIGGLVANVFEHTGKWQEKVFELAGDQRSVGDVAQQFSRRLGREVSYVQIPWEQYEQKAGPESTKMLRWFEEKGHHADIAAARQAVPALHSFDAWLNSAWQEASRAALSRR
jgi:uncharacterized protein YbjT (DUF2867 family)